MPSSSFYNLRQWHRRELTMQRLFHIGYYAAVLFNTMFAVLSTVTLLGMVFITRPQQVLHNVPPEWWIPLTLIIVPSQVICQFLTWKTVFKKEIPTPVAIARHQKTPPQYLRLPLASLWLANFLIGFVIVVSLFKPDPRVNVGTALMLFVAFITFSLTTVANVYLMLFVRTATSNEKWMASVWRFRLVIDLAIAMTAVIYYRMA